MFRSFTSKVIRSALATTTTTTTGVCTNGSCRLAAMKEASSPSSSFLIASFTTSTRRALLPIKAVEVFSLYGDERKGVLIEQIAVTGSFVEAGDVVAIIETETSQTKCEIYAPENGRLLNLIPKINDIVTIGDPIFTIDTDVTVPQGTSNDSTIFDNDTQMLIEYLQANQGKLDESFIQDFLNKDDNIHRIRSFAFLLRDKFPTLAPTSLRVLEHIKELQLSKIVALVQKQHPEDATAAATEKKSLSIELASTHTDIGITYFRLGDLDNALINLERAREIRMEHMEPNSMDLIGSCIHIGTVKHRQNNVAGAIDEFTKVLEIQKQHYGTNVPHSSIAATLNSIGAMKYQINDFHGALNDYREAVTIQETLLGTHPETAGIYNNIGIALKHVGDNRGALENCKKALKMRQETLGYKHQDTAASHYSLAQMLSEMGEYDGSIEQYEHTLQIQKDAYGDSPITASTMNNIGAVYYQLRNLDKALEYYNMALTILQTKFGTNHVEVASCHNNIGLAHYQKRELDESLTNHIEALNIMKAILNDENHPSLAVTIGCIGNVMKSKGQYEEALQEYRKAHTMLETIHNGSNHPDIGSSYNNMGQALSGQGKYQDSITVYKAARKIFQDTMGPDHVNTGSCSFNIGLSYKEINDIPNAIHEFQDALRIWTPILGTDHPQTKAVQHFLTELGQT